VKNNAIVGLGIVQGGSSSTHASGNCSRLNQLRFLGSPLPFMVLRLVAAS
ncbi:hypothetical protein O988_07771, partial [Pseudogymnoascus sp. VKM F-3808]